AEDLFVVRVGRAIVEQQDGAVLGREMLLQREDLPPVAERLLREQSNLAERVEDDPVRIAPLNLVEQSLHRLAELDLAGMKERHVAAERALLDRLQLEDVDAVERPAVRLGALAKLFLGLGQSDVEHALACAHALHEELQREGRLAGAGIAFDEVEPVPRQTAPEDFVETLDACLREHPRKIMPGTARGAPRFATRSAPENEPGDDRDERRHRADRDEDARPIDA